MSRRCSHIRAIVVAVAMLGVTASVLTVPTVAVAAPAPIVPIPSTGVTADRLPTVQIDGVVWSQAVVGNRVWAGGRFNNARPAGAAPGTNQTPRSNLVVYDITTGVMVSFPVNPSLNAQVLSVAASPDGSRVYVVGDFTSANGVARRRVAAYDTNTGALVTSFNPTGVNSQARAVIATTSAVYVGGGFAGLGNGASRNNLAAFSATDGAVLPWNPNADLTVWALGVTGDGSSVFAGGSFRNVGGQAAYGLAKIGGSGTGTLDTTWRPSVRNAGPDAGISGLFVKGSSVYGTTWVFGPGGNHEGTFKSPVSGSADATDVEWVTDCHGDNYSVFVANDIVYSASHAHYCGNMGGGYGQYPAWRFQMAHAWTDAVGGEILNETLGYTNWHGVEPAPSMVNWLPRLQMGSFTGQSQAAWNVTGTDDYVVMGGEFPRVNDVGQQGLVRFARRGIAPGTEGPRFAATPWTPTVQAVSSSTARVSWPAGWDRDDGQLSYRVIRNGAFGSPRFTTTAVSNWWTLPQLGFVDTGLTPGQTYSYQIVVNDPSGNQVFGSSASITMPTSMPAPSGYATTVRSMGARMYWPLNETSGLMATDRAASPSSGPGIGVTDGRTDNGVTWGQPGAIPGDTAASLGDNDWSRAFSGNCPTTTSCGYGTEVAPDTFSTQLWFRTNTTRGGRLFGFGDVQNGNSGHRDRHIYMNNAGQLVFGVRAQNNSTRTITTPQALNNNQWHMVTATMGPSGMALYVDGVLSGSRTDTTQGEAYMGNWRLGGDRLTGWPTVPTMVNFIGSVDEVAVYPTALSAAQVLTLYQARNSQGGNQPPTAAFTHSETELTASFNASTSNDPDGSISSYAWNFGDGTTGTGVAPSKTYASAGTRTVTLTVTDNGGATGQTSQQVTVSVVDPNIVATDQFDRTVSNGWGSADTGGAWTTTTAASNFAVGGGVGTLQMATGSGPSAYLQSVSARDVDLVTTLGYDKSLTGGGTYTSAIVRRIGTSDYRARIRATATGTIFDLVRTVDGTSTVVATQTLAGVVITVDEMFQIRLQAQGSGTTTLRAKFWESGTAEPGAWMLTTTDSTAALQNPGGVGYYSYLSSSATNGPITLRVLDLQVNALA